MKNDIQMLPVWNGISFPKPRLPKAFSWAVGVERLSERFSDLPQVGNLQVWFDDHPIQNNPRVTMATAVDKQLPQQVLTVWYSTTGDSNWYFMVYPVESKRRAHVRDLLEEQAYPAVEKWMKKKWPSTWLQTDKHLRCIWDSVADRIEIQEEPH